MQQNPSLESPSVTQQVAPSTGGKGAHFLEPFLISVLLFSAFFLWERTLPDERAILPMGVWRLPNLQLLAFTAYVFFQHTDCSKIFIFSTLVVMQLDPVYVLGNNPVWICELLASGASGNAHTGFGKAVTSR